VTVTPDRPGGPTVGVVVMAYGTPGSADDIEAYYTHIRRGRPPSAEQIATLRARYEALGGTSSLAARTASQIAVLDAALEASAPGRFAVTLGQKHASPFIEDGVGALARTGVEHVVGVVLAPHFSRASVGEYQARAAEAAAAAGIGFTPIERWHDLPEYRSFLASSVRDALADLPPATEVVFTAHSLPERVLVDDPYADELADSAAAVAAACDLAGATGSRVDGPTWSIGWQSAGATPEPWRGPDILDLVRAAASDRHVDALLVCPQGFVADHLEVAYDLDIETAALAGDLGIGFARTAVLNDDAAVLGALAGRIIAAAPAPASASASED
jgi:ferrochelatase